MVVGAATPLNVGALLGDAPSSLRIAASIGFLNTTEQDLLNQLVQEIYAPGSYMYHSYLSAQEYSNIFAPSDPVYAGAVSYFQSFGISTFTDKSKLFLNLEGTVSQFQKAFATSISMFSGKYFKFYANTDPLYLPSSISPYLTSVIGLENYTFFVPTLAAMTVSQSPTSPIPPFSPPYQPGQIQAAYNETGLINNGVTGAGESIVLIDAGYGDKTIQADMAEFSLTYGLPVPIVSAQTVNASDTVLDVTNDAVAGVLANFPITGGLLGVPPGSGWDFETALDVEWAHSLAPGASLVNMLSFDPGPGLAEAVATSIANHAGNILSQSFGEYDGSNDGGANSTGSYGIGSQSLINYIHPFYAEAAAEGITVLASSGDWGNTCPGASAFDIGVCYPASDPYVTAVGGTSLTVGSSGWKAESTWTCDPGCTGGGFSSVFARNSTWQNGPGVPISASGRGVPDVAADADPATGVVIVLNGVNYGTLFLIGGTSLASPIWSGVIATIDSATGTSLGFYNPEAYSILNSPEYTGKFHDITLGNNCYTGTPCYQAGPGWDPATGIGSPNVGCLLSGCLPLVANSGVTITSPTLEQNINSSALTVTGTHTLPPLNWLVGRQGSAPGYLTGQQQDQLNILQAYISNYRAVAGQGFYNVNLVMSNLTNILLPPPPSEGEWWVIQWTFEGTPYFGVMTLYEEGGINVNGTGVSIAGISFQYGTIVNSGGTSFYQSTAQTNGTYTKTAPGRISMTIPASGTGLPSLGSTFTGVTAVTFEVVGTSLLAGLEQVDTVGSTSYTLGDPLLPNGYVQVALDSQFVGAAVATLSDYPAGNDWSAQLSLAGLPSGTYTVYARQVINGTPGFYTSVYFTLTSNGFAAATLLVQTNRQGYAAGGSVKITGTLKTSSGVPIAGRQVGLEADDPDGGVVFVDQLVTDSAGAFSDAFTIPRAAPSGIYQLLASSTGVAAKTIFSVAKNKGGASMGSATGSILQETLQIATSVQVLNGSQSQQSTFTNGQQVMANVTVRNTGTQAQTVTDVVEFIGPGNVPVFVAGTLVTLQPLRSTSLTASIVLGTTVPFSTGTYFVLNFAWNGFVQSQGASWRGLAIRSSATFQAVTGSSAPPAPPPGNGQTTTGSLNLGVMKSTLQISTNQLFQSVPRSAFSIGVPIKAVYNPQSGYVDFLGGFASNILPFDTSTGLVHSVQILTPTSPGTLISEASDPKDGTLFVLDGNIANYYSTTTGARMFILQGNNYDLQATVGLGNGTFGMAEAYDPMNDMVYVGLANRTSYQSVVEVINGSTDILAGKFSLTMSGTGPDNYPVLQAMVYVPTNNYLYIIRTLLGVANGNFPFVGPYTTGGSSDLVVMDPITGSVVADIPLAEPAMGITYDPANAHVYVTLQGAGGYGPAVAVVDTQTNQVSNIIPLPENSPGVQTFVFLTFISIPRPDEITYDPQNGNLYVGTINANLVYVISGATNSLIDTIQTPIADYNPESITYDSSNGALYVAAETGVGLAINGLTNQITAAYVLQGLPADALYDPLNKDVYVNSISQGSVYVISSLTGRVVATLWPGDPYVALPVALGSSMALDPVSGMIYLTNPDMSKVSVIDGATNTITRTISFPSDLNNTYVPDGIVYDSSNGYLYVTLADCQNNLAGVVTVGTGTVNVCSKVGTSASASVAVIDPTTNSIVRSIKVGVFPEAAVYDPANNEIYIATYNGTASIQVIDTRSNVQLGTIDLGSLSSMYLTSLTYDSANGDVYAYAVGSSPSTVLVVDTSSNTLVGALTTGGPYAGIAYDPVNQLIYTNLGGVLQAIDGATNKIVGTVSTGSCCPTSGGGIAVDTQNGTLYAPFTNVGFVSTVATTPRLPISFFSLETRNSLGNPQSTFLPGDPLMINLQLQSSSGTTTRFLGGIIITDANGNVAFTGTQWRSIGPGGSDGFTYVLTIPAMLAPGTYNITAFAWNGFPSQRGSTWKVLALPITTSFTVT